MTDDPAGLARRTIRRWEQGEIGASLIDASDLSHAYLDLRTAVETAISVLALSPDPDKVHDAIDVLRKALE